jgi:hypothetical protein
VKRLAFWGALIGALAVVSVAIAAPFKFSGGAFDSVPRFMKAGFYAGSSSVASTTNQVTSMIACQCDEDFASIAGTQTMRNPNACTCTGVKMGDPCFAGVAQAGAADGGSAWQPGITINTIARSANTVEIYLTNNIDAGTFDPQDAGYLVRCISNQ